ncbi:TPA_asm: US3.6 uORF [Human alphaherpesvirus 1]|jgi:hypothetical protein
MSIL